MTNVQEEEDLEAELQKLLLQYPPLSAEECSIQLEEEERNVNGLLEECDRVINNAHIRAIIVQVTTARAVTEVEHTSNNTSTLVVPTTPEPAAQVVSIPTTTMTSAQLVTDSTGTSSVHKVADQVSEQYADFRAIEEQRLREEEERRKEQERKRLERLRQQHEELHRKKKEQEERRERERQLRELERQLKEEEERRQEEDRRREERRRELERRKREEDERRRRAEEEAEAERQRLERLRQEQEEAELRNKMLAQEHTLAAATPTKPPEAANLTEEPGTQQLFTSSSSYASSATGLLQLLHDHAVSRQQWLEALSAPKVDTIRANPGPSFSESALIVPPPPASRIVSGTPITRLLLQLHLGPNVPFSKVRRLKLTLENLTQLRELDSMPLLTALNVSCNQLTSLDGLQQAPRLRELIASDNQLASMAGVAPLTSLTTLHLGVNRLTTIEGLHALDKLLSLQLDNNLLSHISGLANCTSLERLKLYRNRLTRIEGLDTLTRLQLLDLGRNYITAIEGLDHCPLLTCLVLYQNRLQALPQRLPTPLLGELWVSGNALRTLQLPPFVPLLEHVYASDNLIESVSGLHRVPLLRTLDLAFNNITDLDGLLTQLMHCTCLTSLRLTDNPVTAIPNYRATAVAWLPSLRDLDNEPISLAERERAETLTFQKQAHLIVPYLRDCVRAGRRPRGPVVCQPNGEISTDWTEVRRHHILQKLASSPEVAAAQWTHSTFVGMCAKQARQRSALAARHKREKFVAGPTEDEADVADKPVTMTMMERHSREMRALLTKHLEQLQQYRSEDYQRRFRMRQAYTRQAMAAAARVLQLWWRAVWPLRRARKAALTIQRAWRRFRARKEAARMRRRMLRHKKHVAAIQIQRVFRGYRIRKRFAALMRKDDEHRIENHPLQSRPPPPATTTTTTSITRPPSKQPDIDIDAIVERVLNAEKAQAASPNHPYALSAAMPLSTHTTLMPIPTRPNQPADLPVAPSSKIYSPRYRLPLPAAMHAHADTGYTSVVQADAESEWPTSAVPLLIERRRRKEVMEQHAKAKRGWPQGAAPADKRIDSLSSNGWTADPMAGASAWPHVAAARSSPYGGEAMVMSPTTSPARVSHSKSEPMTPKLQSSESLRRSSADSRGAIARAALGTVKIAFGQSFEEPRGGSLLPALDGAARRDTPSRRTTASDPVEPFHSTPVLPPLQVKTAPKR